MSNNYHRPATVDERLLLMRSKRNNNTRKKSVLCISEFMPPTTHWQRQNGASNQLRTPEHVSCLSLSRIDCSLGTTSDKWKFKDTESRRIPFWSHIGIYATACAHARARALVDNATMHTVIAEDRPIRHTHTQTKSEKSRLTRPLCWGSNDFRSFWWDYKWMGIARTGYSISHSAISAIKKMKQKKKQQQKKREHVR